MLGKRSNSYWAIFEIYTIINHMKNYKYPLFKKLAESIGEPEGAEQLVAFLNSLADGRDVPDPFFSKALWRIRREIKNTLPNEIPETEDFWKVYWSHLFPEALAEEKNYNERIEEIRKSRIISIEELNSNPLKNIADELSFTSNILLTLPNSDTTIDELDLPVFIREKIPEIQAEEQIFWFDHPVQIGVSPAENEIIYGLKGLSQTLDFEKERGTVPAHAKLDVLLSVSVTHKGLQDLAASYISFELKKAGGFPDLNIYIFTENDCREILGTYCDYSESVSQYFGVDGKYGRHYNFLKAVNVLWRLAINPDLKGTFKIDLDQIFPEETLVSYTGKSAFEHFQSPLWGANAVDVDGKSVSLSMIAGALVNEKDIGTSLFTPDVSLPDENEPISDLIFFKHLTMALSTRAEMMTRYDQNGEIDGINKALSRIHVTGGTNGILIDALMKYRPFTPSFIGRAEDQAYLLSVLSSNIQPALRYYHEDGLIMRHDKEAFAGQSIKAAKDGTFIADIMRILYFSYYAKALPGGVEKTRESTYPFTASYISHFPFTLAYLRLVFKLLELFNDGEKNRAEAMLDLSRSRLGDLADQLDKENFAAGEYQQEKEQWKIFYDEVESLQKRIKDGEKASEEKIKRLREKLTSCQVNPR